MVGAHRCVRGHTWTTAAGQPAGTCPECGAAPASARDPADTSARPFVVPVDAERAGPDTNQLTSLHLGDASSSESVPSFSSLVGMPTPPTMDAPPDHFANTRDYRSAKKPRPGSELPRPEVPGYDILDELGRGGMGVVYKARQQQLNRPVALKMILSGAHAGPSERERFRREAEAVAQLQNPHIVQIFEIGEANGHPYLALEFVDGGSLAQQLDGAPWSAKDAAALVELLARAVHYAHEQGVVHRDLKPGNILLNARGSSRSADSSHDQRIPPAGPASGRTPHAVFQPKITDFGLAKRIDSAVTDGATKTGAVMGTPSYIAPEQASGKVHDVGPPADVYALGAILYELLTGRPPFRGESPLDTVLQVIHDDPVPPKRLVPGVPRDLDTICTTCLAKLPTKRYASAMALAEDLRRFLNGEPITARPLSAWGRGVKWARRHPALTVLATATVVATVGLVAVLSVAYARVADAAEQTKQEANAAEYARTKEAEARHKAERLAADYLQAKNETDALAASILAAKQQVDAQALRLREEGERTRRAAFALQLAQVAALCERDPKRAEQLLDDTTRCPLELRDFTWAYLRRLCHREDRIYLEHDRRDALAAVAASPNGAFVATAGRDGSIRLWDPRTGRTWAVFYGHANNVTGLAFAPDSAALVSVAADGSLRLWEVPANVLETARRTVNAMPFLQTVVKPATLSSAITIPNAHAGGANCVAFAPDGRTVVSAGADGYVRVWDLSGWRFGTADQALAGGPAAVGFVYTRSRGQPASRRVRVLWEHPAHTGPVLALSVSSSSRTFATGGDDRIARVWSLDGPTQLAEIANHNDAVRAVALSPDGRTLATSNNGSSPTIRLHDLASNTDLHRLIGHTAPIHALAISPDGQLLASGSFDRTVRIWNLEDGKDRSVLQGHDQGVTGLCFGADRRTVASIGSDASARVWLTGIRFNETADVSPNADLSLAATSGSGSPLVVVEENGRLQILLTELGPGGGKNAATGVGGTFTPWPVPIAAQPRGTIRTATATPDGRLVIVATDEGFFVWRIHQLRSNLPSGSGTMPLPVARPFHIATPQPVGELAVDPENRTMASIDAEGIRLWELAAVPIVHDRDRLELGPRLIPGTAGARRIAFIGERRIAAAFDADLRIVDAEGVVPGRCEFRGTDRIEAIAFDPVLRRLAAADAGGIIHIVDVAPDFALVPRVELTGHTDAVLALSFSPDGRTLASGGTDRQLHLWDPVTGNERAALGGHTDRIIRVQFAADGQMLTTIDRSGTVKRWRTETPNPKKSPGPPPPQAMQKLKK